MWTFCIQGDTHFYITNYRWLVLGVPTDRWPVYLSEVYRVLKPGTGWLQMLEFDREGVGRVYSENDSVPEESALSKVPQEAIFRNLTPVYRNLPEVYGDGKNGS